MRTRKHTAERNGRATRRAIRPIDQLTIDPSYDALLSFDAPDDIKRAIEAVLFASGEPVSLPDTAHALGVTLTRLTSALTELAREYDLGNRGICVKIFGDSAQMISRPSFAPMIRQALQPIQRQPLSRHVLETLAVIAYHQPVTRAEIDQTRGVISDASVRTLISRGLIKELGRRETLGRPMELGTTDLFLRHFGLSALGELPDPTAIGEADEEERMTV